MLAFNVVKFYFEFALNNQIVKITKSVSRYILSILLIVFSATGSGKPYSTAVSSAIPTAEVIGGGQAYYSPFTQMSHRQRQSSTFATTALPIMQNGWKGGSNANRRGTISFSPQAGALYSREGLLRTRTLSTINAQHAMLAGGDACVPGQGADAPSDKDASGLYAHTSAVNALFRVERLTAITCVTARSCIGETIGGVYTPQSKRYASPIVPPGDDDNTLGGTPQPIVPPGDDDTPLAPVGDVPPLLLSLLIAAYLLPVRVRRRPRLLKNHWGRRRLACGE